MLPSPYYIGEWPYIQMIVIKERKLLLNYFLKYQKHITPFEINKAKDSFIAYLEVASIDETKKR